MTTAGERLVFLSGLSSEFASVHLLAIGSGSTAQEILLNYSGLSTGTAAQHILIDKSPTSFGGTWMILNRRCRRL
jgi:hypothetical protein